MKRENKQKLGCLSFVFIVGMLYCLLHCANSREYSIGFVMCTVCAVSCLLIAVNQTK